MREGRGVRGCARETSPNGSARVDASLKGAWARAKPPLSSRVRARASSWQLQPRVLSLFVVSAGRGRRTCAREGASGLFMRSLAAAVVSAATNTWRRWISRARDAPAGRRGWFVARVEGWRGATRLPGFVATGRILMPDVSTRPSSESVSARLSAFTTSEGARSRARRERVFGTGVDTVFLPYTRRLRRARPPSSVPATPFPLPLDSRDVWDTFRGLCLATSRSGLPP